MRAKTSTLVHKTPKKPAACCHARRPSERSGKFALADVNACREHAVCCCGASATLEPMQVVAHLDTEYRAADCLQMGAAVGSQLSWPMPALSVTINTPAARSSVSGGPRAESGRLDVGSAGLAWRRHQLEHPARIESSRVRGNKPVPPRA